MAQKTISEQIEALDKKIEIAETKREELTKRIADLKNKRKVLEKKENSEFFKELQKQILDSGLTSEIDKAQIKTLIAQLSNQ